MRRAYLTLAFICASLSAAGTAAAQSDAEFVAAFAGAWQVYDDSFAVGGAKCAIDLGRTGTGGRYGLVKSNCGGELASSEQWGIVDRQLAFLDKDGLVVVRLGGNQRRMTGTSAANTPVIFDRVGSGGLATQLEAVVKASGCLYLGFTDKCAPPSELTNPAKDSTTGAKVNVIVNLNARSEARDDAEPVGIVPNNSCIAVDTCLEAADGIWCRAKFGEKTGWLRKIAIRQNRWPVITYLNECKQAEQLKQTN